MMATYVLVHGGFVGSWCWTGVARLLRAAGHDVYAPSQTGLGERGHLASPAITLDTHILDVSGTLICEELRDVVLVGWSYGGMVITGVAERMPERIAHLVFLDAFTPTDGESVGSMLGPEGTLAMVDLARKEGNGWRFGGDGDPLPANGRRLPQPLLTLLQPLTVRNPAARTIPQTFIRCTNRQWPSTPWHDAAAATLDRCAGLAHDAGWGYHDLPTDHGGNMTTDPHILADLLLTLASTDQAS
jgi:pimeloyl-ACP methyl ester carboxylesterase